MPEQQHYDEVVRCLSTQGYEVLPDSPGYIVRHRSDHTDVSKARHLADLIDLAELFEYQAQRQRPRQRPW